MPSKSKCTTKGVLPESDGKLSDKSILIFRSLARGLSIEEILAFDPSISREHISLAAREALVLNNAARSWRERLDQIVKRHPNAYEKWTRVDEEKIVEMYTRGKTIREISAQVQRPPSAVKNRLDKLGLFS
jgi:uncharacterized protein (DUF433 family)